MGIVAEAQRIKQVHPDYLILYKSGGFFKSFGKDAYILSAVFDYQIKKIEKNIATCGFPSSAIFKVRARLEEMKINYILIDPRNNYDVDLKEDFDNLNHYQEEFEKAYHKTKCKKKISHITEELSIMIEKPYFKDVIRKIEDILDETREV